MKKLIMLLAAALFSLSIAGITLAAEQVTITKDTAKKPSIKKERTVSKTATVEAIDLSTRIVTLKSSKGILFDIKAGEEVKKLDHVKVGDQVKVVYYQAVAVEVLTPGQTHGGVQGAVILDRANAGVKPAGAAAGLISVTATVESVDSKNKLVTLKGPQGRVLEVKVKEANKLKNIKTGDEIVVTLTEALAVSVETVNK